MHRPSHPPWFDHSNNIWWGVQVMKLLIMQPPPASFLIWVYGIRSHECISLDSHREPSYNPLWRVKIHVARTHVKLVPCHHATANLQVADGGDGLQICGIPAVMLNKLSWSAGKGWYSSLETRKSCEILVGKPEARRQLWRRNECMWNVT